MATTKKKTTKAAPKTKSTARSTKAKCGGCKTAKRSTKTKAAAKKK